MSFRVLWKNLNVADLSLIRDIHSSTANLSDGDDIFRCSHDFIRKANSILVKFSSCDPFVLTKLLTCFCMSFYGCALWPLDSCAVKHLDVCINVCEVSGKCHTSLLLSVSGCLILVMNISVICFIYICLYSCNNNNNSNNNNNNINKLLP